MFQDKNKKVDSELKQTIEDLNAVEAELKPYKDKLAALQDKAKLRFYSNKDSAELGNKVLHYERLAKAHNVISGAVKAFQDDAPVSGLFLYSALYTGVQVFPSLSSVKEQKEYFFQAALDSVLFKDPNERETYKDIVESLWEECEPYAVTNVKKVIAVNKYMTEVMTEALDKK